MNILFTTSQGDVAGSTNSIFYLATGLAARGHNVYLACRSESLLFRMLENTPVKRLEIPFKKKVDFKAAREIRDVVRKYKIDLINSQSGKDRYAVIVSRIVYGNKCPHINTRRQRPKSDGGKLLNRFITRHTEKIVAVSESIKSDLASIGYPEDHIEVIHNGTPVEKYKKPNEELRETLRKELEIHGNIPVLGSVSRPKKHSQLLEALNFLDRTVKLVLVGIEKVPEYESIIKTYTLPHEIHFIGTVSNETALAYLSLFDIKILPSTMEGISQSILEAMAMEVPVIATRASGTPEIINDGKNGILFEDGDIDGLVQAISRLLNEPKLRVQITAAGKITSFETFSIQKTLDNYISLFKSLIDVQR